MADQINHATKGGNDINCSDSPAVSKGGLSVTNELDVTELAYEPDATHRKSPSSLSKEHTETILDQKAVDLQSDLAELNSGFAKEDMLAFGSDTLAVFQHFDTLKMTQDTLTQQFWNLEDTIASNRMTLLGETDAPTTFANFQAFSDAVDSQRQSVYDALNLLSTKLEELVPITKTENSPSSSEHLGIKDTQHQKATKKPLSRLPSYSFDLPPENVANHPLSKSGGPPVTSKEAKIRFDSYNKLYYDKDKDGFDDDEDDEEDDDDVDNMYYNKQNPKYRHRHREKVVLESSHQRSRQRHNHQGEYNSRRHQHQKEHQQFSFGPKTGLGSLRHSNSINQRHRLSPSRPHFGESGFDPHPIQDETRIKGDDPSSLSSHKDKAYEEQRYHYQRTYREHQNDHQNAYDAQLLDSSQRSLKPSAIRSTSAMSYEFGSDNNIETRNGVCKQKIYKATKDTYPDSALTFRHNGKSTNVPDATSNSQHLHEEGSFGNEQQFFSKSDLTPRSRHHKVKDTVVTAAPMGYSSAQSSRTPGYSLNISRVSPSPAQLEYLNLTDQDSGGELRPNGRERSHSIDNKANHGFNINVKKDHSIHRSSLEHFEATPHRRRSQEFVTNWIEGQRLENESPIHFHLAPDRAQHNFNGNGDDLPKSNLGYLQTQGMHRSRMWTPDSLRSSLPQYDSTSTPATPLYARVVNHDDDDDLHELERLIDG